MFIEILWQVASQVQGTEAPVACCPPGASVLVTSQLVNKQYIDLSKGRRSDSWKETVVHVTRDHGGTMGGQFSPLEGEVGHVSRDREGGGEQTQAGPDGPLKATGHGVDCSRLGLIVVGGHYWRVRKRGKRTCLRMFVTVPVRAVCRLY